MPFVLKYPELMNQFKTALIQNSITLTVGDAIVPGTTATQVTTAASTTGRILGVVKSILQNGTYTGLNSIAAGASNVTTTMYGVEYIPAYLPMEWEVDLQQATGTTSGSAGMGMFNMYSTAGKLDETTYVPYNNTTLAQFFSFGVAADSTSKVVGKFTSQWAVL